MRVRSLFTEAAGCFMGMKRGTLAFDLADGGNSTVNTWNGGNISAGTKTEDATQHTAEELFDHPS